MSYIAFVIGGYWCSAALSSPSITFDLHFPCISFNSKSLQRWPLLRFLWNDDDHLESCIGCVLL